MPICTRKGGRRERKRAEYPCMSCKEEVTGRHHAMECDVCRRWQHRKCCTTAITLSFYQAAVISDKPFRWTCTECMCKVPTSQEDDKIMDEDSHEDMGVDELPPPPAGAEEFLVALMANPKVSPPPGFRNFLDEDLQEVFSGVQRDEESLSSQHDGHARASSHHESDVSMEDLGLPLAESSRTSVLDHVADGSPNVADIIIQPVHEVLEESLLDLTVSDDNASGHGDEIVYNIVGTASQRQRPKLLDSRGFTYTKYKENKDGSTTWSYTGQREGYRTAVAPASQIVDQALVNNITNAPIPLVPKPSSLARTANRVRQRQRPVEPRDLKFAVQFEAIPDDFLQTDVKNKQRRHLVFSTPNQQVLLARGKRWYLDATFKVVKAPFTQLFGIHCFIKKGNSTKQVSLVFVLMSGKKKRDYIAVLRAVRDLLPKDICLEEVLVDFEHALWKAMEAVFPNVVIKGCCFQWKQAVWRKIQETGLQPAYMEKADFNRLLSNLMGLPFLPAEFILPMFQSPRRKAGTPMLQRVFDYVAATWVTGPVWPPTSWSCYGQSIRTNNDCEGWHLRLLTKARKTKVPLYLLIKVLHSEALFVEVQVKLVSEHKLKKHQRKTYRKTQRLVFKYWGEFANGERSAKSLLHACACLF